MRRRCCTAPLHARKPRAYYTLLPRRPHNQPPNVASAGFAQGRALLSQSLTVERVRVCIYSTRARVILCVHELYVSSFYRVAIARDYKGLRVLWPRNEIN